MARSGCKIEHFDMVAAKARRNAAKNKYAHLKWPGCTADDIAKMEMLIWPMRFGHVCQRVMELQQLYTLARKLLRNLKLKSQLHGLKALQLMLTKKQTRVNHTKVQPYMTTATR